MGRTVTPYSQEYIAFQQRAQKYRRALRAEDQQVLDEVLELGRLNNQSGVCSAAPFPIESFLLGTLVEFKKTINHLQAQLTQMREQLQLPVLPAPATAFCDDRQPRFQFPAAERGGGDADTTG
jgi:hypothetical protein